MSCPAYTVNHLFFQGLHTCSVAALLLLEHIRACDLCTVTDAAGHLLHSLGASSVVVESFGHLGQVLVALDDLHICLSGNSCGCAPRPQCKVMLRCVYSSVRVRHAPSVFISAHPCATSQVQSMPAPCRQ